MATALIGALRVTLGLNSAEFEKGANRAKGTVSDLERQIGRSTKNIQKLGESMSSLGKRMTIGVTAPLVALAAKSVQGAQEQAQAMAQVNAALKSMGAVSGKTSVELSKTADALELRSLYNADEILKKVTANLLTFGNVSGEVFDRAQQAAVDMSARLGQDLQSSAVMLGKALNDPIKGLTALGRVGVQFTKGQKAQIEAMAEAGNVAGAQGIILAELERQFKGAAQAAADTSPWRKAQVAIDQAMDKIGEAILPVIPVIADAIKSVADAFSSLSPGMQKAIVVVGVLAAVFGPVLIAVGAAVTALAPLIAAAGFLAGTIGGLTGIIVAAGAAVGALAVALAPILIPLAAVAVAVTAVYLAWKHWDKIKAFVSDIGAAVSGWWNGTVKPVFAALGQALVAAGNLWGGLKTAAINSISALVTGVRDWLTNKLSAVWDTVKSKIDAVKGWFKDLYIAVVGNSYVPDMVDGIAAQMKRLDAVMVDPAKKAAVKTKEIFRQLASDVRSIMDDLFPEAAALVETGRRRNTLAAGRDAGLLGSGLEGRANFSEAIDRENARLPVNDNAPAAIAGWGNLLPIMQPLNAEFDRFAATVTESLPNLSQFNGVFAGLGESMEGFRQDLARAFTDVIMGAASFGDALRGVFNRLASKILDNMFDQLLGNLLGGIIPGFASGTNFAPGGMALVGERGPEIVNLPRGSQVIPNDKLGGMGGQTNFYVTVKGGGTERENRATGRQIGAAIAQEQARARRFGIVG